MKNKEENIVKIDVNFYEVKTGWIKFKVKAGKQIFEGFFSEVFDPIIDFKKWLEAITLGVQQTSFEYDSEGYDVKFDFKRVSWDREVFTISDPYQQKRIFIKAIVDRKQLVKAFYMGFYNFSNSDIYKPKEWEFENYEERLCEVLKVDKETLLQNLIELNGKELSKLLFDIAPSYMISFPSAENKNEENATASDEKVRNAIAIDLPENYNLLENTKKIEFLNNYLKLSISVYNGTKLTEFRSSIIGKYLYEA